MQNVHTAVMGRGKKIIDTLSEFYSKKLQYSLQGLNAFISLSLKKLRVLHSVAEHGNYFD
jgi:hypothetical protein